MTQDLSDTDESPFSTRHVDQLLTSPLYNHDARKIRDLWSGVFESNIEEDENR